MRFTAPLLLNGKTATGIRVPDDVMTSFGDKKRVPVRVTINGVAYPSTISTMGGDPMIPVSAEIRAAAGIEAGQQIEVELLPDEAPRAVEVPEDLRAALGANAVAAERFAALSYSNQRRYVIAVTGAKTGETRSRRIRKILDELLG